MLPTAIITTLLLSVSLVASRSGEQRKCYHPDGSEAPVAYQPCSTTVNNSMCCATNRNVYVNECRPDGLCKQLDQGYIWRESCTDPTWKAKECLRLCYTGTVEGENYPDDVLITVCADGSYCCGYNNAACCNNHQGYWIVNGVVTTTKPTGSSVPSIVPPTSAKISLTALPSALPSAVRCSGSGWDPSPTNWNNANADNELLNWWSRTASQRGSHTFVDWLSSQFGDKTPNSQCGIHRFDTCLLPQCAVWENAKAPNWAFFTRVSLVEMNLLFNTMWDGIAAAQSSISLILTEMASDFFPWSQSDSAKMHVNEVAPWLDVAASAALSLVPPPYSIVAGVVGPFVGGGIQALADPDLTRRRDILSIQSLGQFIRNLTDTFCQRLDTWSREIFDGKKDSSGYTILDYMRGGRFTLNYDVPSYLINDLYVKLMISKFVNAQWRAQNQTYHIYVMCTNSSEGPCQESSIYRNSNYSCCAYSMDTKLNLGPPPSLDKLVSAPYSIDPQNISASSLLSYQLGGINYDEGKSTDYILAFQAQDMKKQLFSIGTAAPGIWTLPVCDVGSHADWVANYSAKKYPCCCGANCVGTSAFMKVIGAGSSLNDVCKSQFPDYTPVSGGVALTQTLSSKLAWVVAFIALGLSI